MKHDLIQRIVLGEYKNCYLSTNQIIINNNAYVQNDLKLFLTFSDDMVECELTGMQELDSRQMNELIGEVAKCYHENTFGFINLDSNPLLTRFKTKNGNHFFETNQKIIEITEGIFNKYNVHLSNKIIRTGKQKGSAFRPNAKVMIFRNPFISSKKTSFGQTYIVADEISINLIEEG